MKKILLTAAAVAAVLLPAGSADATPKHHHGDKPVVSRAIDWD